MHDKFIESIKLIVESLNKYIKSVVQCDEGVLQTIKINAYGTNVPLKHVASLASIENNQVSIHVHDKGLKTEIEAVMSKLKIGSIRPGNANSIIFSFNQLTKQELENRYKQIKIQAEESRNKMRIIRREYLTEANIDKSEDVQRKNEKDIQKIIDEHNKQIDMKLKQFANQYLE